MMNDVVITANTAIGSVLALAQAIKKKIDCNIYVLCTDEITSQILEKSNFIKEVKFVQASDADSYLTDVKRFIKSQKFSSLPILYSTTDTSCFYINENRNWFEENFILSLPSKNIIYKFTKKGLAEKEAELNGLITPKTYLIQNKTDVEHVISNFKFPIILKPQATYIKNNINFKIKVLENKKQLLEFYRDEIEVLCQEFIPGGNDVSYYCMFYRNSDGKLYVNIGKKTLQSTPNGGIMLKGKSDYNLEIYNITKNFLDRINYVGMGGIEFKKYNGVFYFIEMSVRLEGFFKLAESSGSNLSLISYIKLSNLVSDNDLICRQKDGIVYMDGIPLFLTYLRNKNFLCLCVDFMKFIFGNSFFNTFSISDIKPLFKQISILLNKGFKR